MSARVDASRVSSREALRAAIDAVGFLDGAQTTVRSRAGRPLSWLLYTPELTLTSEGSRLAAECLLQLLPRFGTTQLAAYGLTGLPLMLGTVMVAGGPYHGLIVRAAPKAYGSMRQIEGPINWDEPVVVIDDSLSSGASFRHAARALEAAGLNVAGVACLVDFRSHGGRSWAESLGYRVEAVFDIWRDLRFWRSYANPPTLVNTPIALPPERRDESELHTLPNVARAVATALLRGDRISTVAVVPGHDTSGGAFVSFRDIVTDARLVRDGFLCVDTEGPSAARSVAAATERCVARAHQLDIARLETTKVAVTCVSRLEEVLLSDLDSSRYGLLIRGSELVWKMGAALPNTPERESEVQQYRECLRKAGMRPDEPHQLYRYTVTKVVEAGRPWQPYGVPASEGTEPPEFVDYLRERFTRAASGEPIASSPTAAPPEVPWTVHGVGVSLYFEGQLVGVAVNMSASLVDALHTAVTHAWRDALATSGMRIAICDCAAIVSVLHTPHAFGTMTDERASRWFRPSEHLVFASSGAVAAASLPHFACHHGWDALKTARLVMRKGGFDNDRPPAWTSYKTSSWLMTASRADPIVGGFRRRENTEAIDANAMAAQIAGYILRQSARDGLPTYTCSPFAATSAVGGTASRILLAAAALADAAEVLHRSDLVRGASTAAERVANGLQVGPDGLTRLTLREHKCGALADCHALVLLSSSAHNALGDARVERLADRIWRLFRPDGMISDLPEGRRLGSDCDVLPGAALAAVARYSEANCGQRLPGTLDEQLAWCRQRFRSYPTWIGAGWLMQGWAAIWRLSACPSHSDFVLELADWAIQRQFANSGGFMTDLSDRGPGFNTGFMAEGIAEAWGVSRALSEDFRTARLASSWSAAIRFMRALMVEKSDLYCMPGGLSLLGGVRHSIYDSSMRIDYAAHLLRALIGGIRNGATPVSATVASSCLPPTSQKPRRRPRSSPALSA